MRRAAARLFRDGRDRYIRQRVVAAHSRGARLPVARNHPGDVQVAAAVGAHGQHRLRAPGHRRTTRRPTSTSSRPWRAPTSWRARRRLRRDHPPGQLQHLARRTRATSASSRSSGVKVEVMGDLIIRCADGMINASDHFARWSDKVRVLHFERHAHPRRPARMAARRQRRCCGAPSASSGIAAAPAEPRLRPRVLWRLLLDRQTARRAHASPTVRRLLHLEPEPITTPRARRAGRLHRRLLPDELPRLRGLRHQRRPQGRPALRQGALARRRPARQARAGRRLRPRRARHPVRACAAPMRGASTTPQAAVDIAARALADHRRRRSASARTSSRWT